MNIPRSLLVLILSLAFFLPAQADDEARQLPMEKAEKSKAMAQKELEKAREEMVKAKEEMRRAKKEVRIIRKKLEGEKTPRAIIGVVLDKESPKAVKISAVTPNSAAKDAGVLPGDLIVKVNGEKIAGSKSESAALRKSYDLIGVLKEGDKVVLDILRDGKKIQKTLSARVREEQEYVYEFNVDEMLEDIDVEGMLADLDLPTIVHEAVAAIPNVKVTVDPHSDREIHIVKKMNGHSGHSVSEFIEIDDNGKHTSWISKNMSSYGLNMTPLNQDLGEYFSTKEGVLILSVDEDNPLKLRSGDVVLKIGDRSTHKPSQLMRILRSYDADEPFEIKIKRNKKSKTLKISLSEEQLGQIPNALESTYEYAFVTDGE